MDLIKLEETFLDHLALRQNCSSSTIKTYRSAFRQAWRFSREMGVDLDTEAVDYTWADLLVEWWCIERKAAPRTVHRNVTALRAMFTFARKRRWTQSDPFANIDLPDKGEVARVHLDIDDQNALVKAAEQLADPRVKAMNQALILTQLTIGTRVSELVELNVADVDLCQQVVHINHGKGDRSREIVLDERSCGALRAWLEVRRQWLDTRETGGRFRGGEPDALWLADRGRRLSHDGVYAILDELVADAGFREQVRIHDLRHATAKRWYREGIPLEVIQHRLGHSSRSTTEQYIKGASPNTRMWAARAGLPAPAAAKDTTEVSVLARGQTATPKVPNPTPAPPVPLASPLQPLSVAQRLKLLQERPLLRGPVGLIGPQPRHPLEQVGLGIRGPLGHYSR